VNEILASIASHLRKLGYCTRYCPPLAEARRLGCKVELRIRGRGYVSINGTELAWSGAAYDLNDPASLDEFLEDLGRGIPRPERRRELTDSLIDELCEPDPVADQLADQLLAEVKAEHS
jgi:hypothetical protein